jgi:hypothetical protein
MTSELAGLLSGSRLPGPRSGLGCGYGELGHGRLRSRFFSSLRRVGVKHPWLTSGLQIRPHGIFLKLRHSISMLEPGSSSGTGNGSSSAEYQCRLSFSQSGAGAGGLVQPLSFMLAIFTAATRPCLEQALRINARPQPTPPQGEARRLRTCVLIDPNASALRCLSPLARTGIAG